MNPRDILRLVITDLGCAVALAVLYSPGLLALSPSASSPLVAAIAIVAAPALLAGAVWENVEIMKPRDTKLIDTGSVNDIDVDELTKRLNDYADELYVGTLAGRIADQVKKANERYEAYGKRISEYFGNGATAQRFSSSVATATQTVIRNAAAAVNLLDATDLSSLTETMKSAPNNYAANMTGMATGATGSDVSQRRRELYQGVLDRLTSIADGNDELLLAIETAQVDLSSLDKTDETTDEALNELERLSQTLDYYK